MNKYKVTRSNKGRNAKNRRKTGAITAGKIVLLSFLVLVFMVFSSVYAFLNIYKPAIDVDDDMQMPDLRENWESPDGEGADDAEQANLDLGDRIWGDAFNILVAATDAMNGLTDTIMLVSFNIKDSMISVMNIPRDIYVNTKQYSGKINSVYQRGYNIGRNEGLDSEKSAKRGMKNLGDMITYTYRVPVDRYVLLNIEGFRFLVDQIGGVEMEVPMRMKYTDPYQNLYIDLQPGFQKLDGNKAEQLVRFRKGDSGFPDHLEGDIGRIQTQQKFIAALAKKILGEFNANTIKAMFEVGEKYMTTNITLANAGWFAVKALDIKLENMRVHMLPSIWLGAPSYAHLSHNEVFREEAIEIINKYYNPYKEDIPESSFNIYDKNITSSTYKPAIDIDGMTMDTLISDK